MSRRPGRELEQLPHYVYIHFNEDCEPIYVGRTAHPESRPWDDSRRKWIATESDEVRVSPAMPFDAAAWMESALIKSMTPKHNQRGGLSPQPLDWRIDRICEAEGVTRAVARFTVRYYPKDPAEFEAALAAALAKRAAS